MNLFESSNLYQKTKEIIPGGVNSPFRFFKNNTLEHPIFISQAEGPHIIDEDGNKYIDYVCSWGSIILGHSHPKIVNAISSKAEKGTTFGAPSKLETELAQKIIDAVSSIDMVRMVNSGTEATMTALKLARAYTRKNKIIRFEGCYHGFSDSLLAGFEESTIENSNLKGITNNTSNEVIVLPYNDIKAFESAVNQHGAENIAAVIIEPVASNMGCILPEEGFLERIREITSNNNIVLIFDEVFTGFRTYYGGVQELFEIKPDLTCLGKVIGGGLPIGVYGGKKDIMSLAAPEGPVYQAGTFSGNPLTMAAGIETLNILQNEEVYQELEYKTFQIELGFKEAARTVGVPIEVNKITGMLSCFFTDRNVSDLKSARMSNKRKYKTFFHEMLKHGIYIPHSDLKVFSISLALEDMDIEKTVESAYKAFLNIKENF